MILVASSATAPVPAIVIHRTGSFVHTGTGSDLFTSLDTSPTPSRDQPCPCCPSAAARLYCVNYFIMSSADVPAIQLNGSTEPTTMAQQQKQQQSVPEDTPSVDSFGEPPSSASRPGPARNDTTFSKFSMMSVPPEGSILTGKQEHCTPHPYTTDCTILTHRQTSSANSYLSRPNTKSQNSPRLQPSSASVHPSDQMQVKSPPKTLNCPSFVIYSYITSATSHS